jgi:OmpA-OmpF porin, OOP family
MKNLFFFLIAFATFVAVPAQELKPTNDLALLMGTVTNFKNKPLSRETIMLVDDKTKKEYKVNTDENGKFKVLVPVDVTYNLKYRNFNMDVDYSKMPVPADKEAVYEVQIQIEPPTNFVIENVYFDTGKSSLKPTSNKALNDLAEFLKLKRTMIIEIQGHTDNVGSPESNLKLSQERAEEVRKFLLTKGIEAERVLAKGYGDSMPIANNDSDTGKSKNRRTSLKVLSD